MKRHITNEHQRKATVKAVESFPLGEHGFDLRITPHEYTRTQEQNSLLWAGAYRPIARFMSEDTGKVITSWHIHEVCKDNFLEHVTNPANGKVYSGSTTKLKKAEFSDYLEQVYEWGASMGVWFE